MINRFANVTGGEVGSEPRVLLQVMSDAAQHRSAAAGRHTRARLARDETVSWCRACVISSGHARARGERAHFVTFNARPRCTIATRGAARRADGLQVSRTRPDRAG